MMKSKRIGTILLVTSLSLAGLYAQPSSSLDWTPVGKAITDAELAYDKDCPLGKCGPTASVDHYQRLSAFAHARDLLASYTAAYVASKGPAPDATSLRLLYRMGIVYDGMEQPADAYKSYEKCINSVGVLQVTYSQDGGNKPLRDLCAKRMEDDCKLVATLCQVVFAPPPPSNVSHDDPLSPTHPYILNIHTTDIKPSDLTVEAQHFSVQQLEHLEQMVIANEGQK